VAGTTVLDGADGAPSPTELVAATVKSYVVPLVKPVTTVVVDGGDPVTTTDGSVVPSLPAVLLGVTV
jgi:hypothetical protein